MRAKRGESGVLKKARAEAPRRRTPNHDSSASCRIADAQLIYQPASSVVAVVGLSLPPWAEPRPSDDSDSLSEQGR